MSKTIASAFNDKTLHLQSQLSLELDEIRVLNFLLMNMSS